MEDPSKPFHQGKDGLSTHAIYHGENTIHNIGSRLIGGIEGVPTAEKWAVREIYSIKISLETDFRCTAFSPSLKHQLNSSIYER